MWRKPGARIPDLTTTSAIGTDNAVIATSSAVKHKTKTKSNKKDYSKGHYHVVCGRIVEVVHEKNNVPYFGGPRYNIDWEDGFSEEAVTANELLKLYCDTPQSLGSRTTLDEDITTALLQIGKGAGIILEMQKRKEAMEVMRTALHVTNLVDSTICERALDLILGLILGAREAGIIGITDPNRGDSVAGEAKPTLTNLGETDVCNLVLRKPIEKIIEKNIYGTMQQICNNTFGSKNPSIPTVTPEGRLMEWISIHIPVPDGFAWHNNSNAHYLVAYIIRNKHGSKATAMIEMENITEMASKISEAISIVWAKEQRKKARKESSHKLENLLPDWALCSSAELSFNVLSQILSDHLPGVNYYVGLLQPGASSIEFIAANSSSKMIGKKLKKDEGVSFDVMDSAKTMVIRADDIDKKKNMGVDSKVKVALGKIFHEAIITADRGHDNYDVKYKTSCWFTFESYRPYSNSI